MGKEYTGNPMNDIPENEPDRQYYFINLGQKILRERSGLKGSNLTFCVTTFGCQMNARDSEKLRGILIRLGFVETEEKMADLVIFNTCTVRENANTRLYGRLGQLKAKKAGNPHMIIGLCGCMMQEEGVVNTIREKYAFVDIIFGTHNIHRLAEMIVHSFTSKGTLIDVWDDTDLIVENLPIQRKYAFKSGVNITFGCNNFCSYCIVPYVRGRERSRNAEDILNEIESLSRDGVSEVMLLGQNVNSYGKSLTPPRTFAELLEKIERIDGIRRIRFMTSHPKDLSSDIIKVMKFSRKICHHIHLPLQSGSNTILKSMGRQYTREKYMEIVNELREAVPDISITTDIIVGFPGETEEDFLDTLRMVEDVKFDSAFTFVYSKRTGTAAAKMENQIPSEVVKERFERLLEVVHKNAVQSCAVHEGQVMEVLVETICQQNAQMVTGRLDNNLLVHFYGDQNLIGRYVHVHLTECRGFYYIGKLVEIS